MPLLHRADCSYLRTASQQQLEAVPEFLLPSLIRSEQAAYKASLERVAAGDVQRNPDEQRYIAFCMRCLVKE